MNPIPRNSPLAQSEDQLVISVNSIATMAPMGTDCEAGACWNMQSLCWVRSLRSFCPSSLHGTFQYCESYLSGKKYPGQFKVAVSIPCTQSVVSSANVLPGIHARQPRAMAAACLVLAAFEATLSKSSQGGNLCLAQRFAFINYVLRCVLYS